MAAPVREIQGAVADAKGRWAGLNRRRASVRHLAEAWGLLNRSRGNQFAAAITYFSFLALFPLLLLAVSVLGFVLSSHPHALQSLLNHITAQVPGSFGTTLKTAIKDAIDARAGVGIVGLAGVLLTGLGWIANLRSAIDAIWQRPPRAQNFLKAKAFDLLVLAGLGVGVLVSVGLTVVGTSVTDQVVQWLDLGGVPGVHALVKVLGIAIALVGDVVIYGWLLVELPDVDVSRRVQLRGALLAAVAFEALKVLGSYTIAHTANSPTSGPFASVLAVLVWIQLVARSMLFACAWTSVLAADEARQAAAAVSHEVVRYEGARPAPSAPPVFDHDARTFGRGAIVGAAVAWVLTRSRLATRRDRRPTGWSQVQ
ncbi:MAG: YhjD/YihY/BrkB family envelope integrity protein [Jatrophihabitans sp.]|uniref:YhjD/YihY/BrkB family envelope integrity protein n=1 Tax=Jatrophihabitans sp. TaxID=1932789 RepID=UPI003F822E98